MDKVKISEIEKSQDKSLHLEIDEYIDEIKANIEGYLDGRICQRKRSFIR